MSFDEWFNNEELNPLFKRVIDVLEKAKEYNQPAGEWSGFSWDKPGEIIFTYLLGNFMLDTKKRHIVKSRVTQGINKFLRWMNFKELKGDFEPQHIISKFFKWFNAFALTPVGSQVILYTVLPILLIGVVIVWWYLEEIPIKKAKNPDGTQIFIKEEVICREEILDMTGARLTIRGCFEIITAIKGVSSTLASIDNLDEWLEKYDLEQSVVERDLLRLGETFYKYRVDAGKFYQWLQGQRENQIITYPKYITLIPPILHNLYFIIKSVQAFLWKDLEGMSKVFTSWGLTNLASKTEELEHSSPIFQFFSTGFSYSPFVAIVNFVREAFRVDDEEYFKRMDDLAESLTAEDMAFLERFLGIGIPVIPTQEEDYEPTPDDTGDEDEEKEIIDPEDFEDVKPIFTDPDDSDISDPVPPPPITDEDPLYDRPDITDPLDAIDDKLGDLEPISDPELHDDEEEEVEEKVIFTKEDSLI